MRQIILQQLKVLLCIPLEWLWEINEAFPESACGSMHLVPRPIGHDGLHASAHPHIGAITNRWARH